MNFWWNIEYPDYDSCRKISSKEVPYVSDSENDWFILARTESFPQDKPVMASIPGDFLQIGVYNARRSAGLRFVLTKVMIPLVMTHVPLSTIYIASLLSCCLLHACQKSKEMKTVNQTNVSWWIGEHLKSRQILLINL